MYSVKRAGQFGGGLQGGDCMSSEKALFACLFSFPFPHFHDHWYALRGCRNTWWLTGGTPYWGGGGCACPLRLSFPRLLFFCSPSTSVFPQTGQRPETVLRLSVATSSWPECVWRARAGWTPQLRHTPWRSPWLFTAKAPRRFFEKVVPVKDGEKDVAAWKKGDHGWPPGTMWEKQINSSRQPCDREPHFVMVAQSLSDWFLRRAHTHTHVCKT